MSPPPRRRWSRRRPPKASSWRDRWATGRRSSKRPTCSECRGARLPERLVQIDIDPTAIGRQRPATVGIQGDARLVAQQLYTALGAGSREPWCDIEAVRVYKRQAV